MTIPEAVLSAAHELVSLHGPVFDYLGQYKDRDVYQFALPNGLYTGYPFLYLYKDGLKKAKEVTGPEALEIISALGIE